MSSIAIEQALSSIYGDMMLSGAIIAILAAIISLMVSRRISKPLEEIRQGAISYTHGDLSHRIHVPESEEIGILAETMNQMASQLAERIQTVTRQRNELEAVLANMVEAVMIINRDGRIVRCNQAASQLFNMDQEAIGQRSIQEMIRNANIHRLVKKTFENGEPAEDVLSLNSGHERFLHVHGTLLRSTEEQATDALFVFHDITRLKQLENMRREFVANVSHELRTPITSIVGFVETLQDGAINDPENVSKFLGIIERNAQRLDSIIKDLLTLSKIEQDREGEQIVLAEARIKDVLETAVMICQKRASEHQVVIDLRCSEELWANINAALLEQAVVNLLDNAIKYSEPGSSVNLSATQQGHEVIIAVEDSGCGIPKEHLPRLFERFYRVDKARSRTLGGTGLGLAIVKHIANAHRGRATVESKIGEGSVFSIIIPVY
jgi:two-component system phosphate regulon sensor histidine kinase PhoR